MNEIKTIYDRNRRDFSIDLLRVIGLLGIILAHTSPPKVILELRAFDVVLLVFVSGISYSISSFNGKKQKYLSYVWKRVKRLVIPAWLFLIAFFAFFSLLAVYRGGVFFVR